MRAPLLVAGTLALLAQEPAFRTTVPLVIAPATVTDREGNYVDGLTAGDFLLFDNRRLQKIHVDVTFVPISLVIAVQSSEIAEPALAKVRKVGSMIEPLVIGEKGEAAVIAFDDRVRVMQDFTSDAGLLAAGLKKIEARGEGGRMIDAVMESVRRLVERPSNRRRVLLLISESRDRSSESKLEDAITLAQRENVMIYPLTYSAFLTAFTARPGTVTPSGGAGINLIAIFAEIARLAKANTSEALSKYTGGRRLSFLKQRSLEDAISRIGEELHSQYVLSFSPALRGNGEFHQIEVLVKGRPDVVVRTRPGYWLEAPAQ